MSFSLSSDASPTTRNRSFWLLFSLLVCSLYMNLGRQPLYLEEPRRALIALEMLFNHNLWVPTEFGQLYFNKPPMWNWVIILSYKIFGVNEFAVRFFSVLSYVIMGLLVYASAKKYVNQRAGMLSSLFFLISVDIYFYFSATGEIDLFYSLITFASILSIYHFYEKQHFVLVFLVSYFLAAIGTLTKGFPSLAFQGISILAFFIYKKDFKRLFSLSHVAGISVFILIVGGFAWAYSRYHSPLGFVDAIWAESSGRTVGHNNLIESLKHLIIFPGNVFVISLPGSLFLLYLLKKGRIKETNSFATFSLIIFLSNIIIYWISAGTRPRYIYMLLPFLIMYGTFLFLQNEKAATKTTHFLNYTWGIFILLMTLATSGLLFLSEAQIIPHRHIVFAVFFPILLLLFLLYLKRKDARMFIFILSIIVFRFAFNFSILEGRAHKSFPQEQKLIAKEMVSIAKEKHIYFYRSSDMPRTMVFYLEKDLRSIVRKSKRFDEHPHDLYVIKSDFLDSGYGQILYNFKLHKTEYYLVKP